MATINWDAVEAQYSGTNYAEAGTYQLKVSEVVVKDITQSGSAPVEFWFDNSEGEVGKHTEWMSFKQGKDAWRQHHMKDLMVMMGASEDAARQAVEKAESGKNNDSIADVYEQLFNKLAPKCPKLTVECYQEEYEKNGEIKHANRACIKHPSCFDPRVNSRNSSAGPSVAKAEEEPEVTKGGELDLSDIPF